MPNLDNLYSLVKEKRAGQLNPDYYPTVALGLLDLAKMEGSRTPPEHAFDAVRIIEQIQSSGTIEARGFGARKRINWLQETYGLNEQELEDFTKALKDLLPPG